MYSKIGEDIKRYATQLSIMLIPNVSINDKFIIDIYAYTTENKCDTFITVKTDKHLRDDEVINYLKDWLNKNRIEYTVNSPISVVCDAYKLHPVMQQIFDKK